MTDSIATAAGSERYGTFALIRRLLAEQGLAHWPRYAIAFVLMGITAGCTALTAYLLGDVINQTYVFRNFPAVVTLGLITLLLFTVKGLSTYGQSVMLSRIGNRIIAD